jgi:hypothetical protein
MQIAFALFGLVSAMILIWPRFLILVEGPRPQGLTHVKKTAPHKSVAYGLPKFPGLVDQALLMAALSARENTVSSYFLKNKRKALEGTA